jgi:opacity protein-like surface antigen
MLWQSFIKETLTTKTKKRNTHMLNKAKLLAGAALVSALLSAAPALAADNEAPNRYDHGFYVGGFGGYGWTDTDTATAGDVDGSDWGAFVGYELTGFMNRMNIGVSAAIEAHYAWSHANDGTGAGAVDKDHEWGISFRPGLSFLHGATPMNLRPYGIIGYRRAEFENSIPGADDDFDGFELGIGTELMAFDNWGVRLDYTHVFYESAGTMDPDEDDLRLGVSYHF